MDHEAAVSSHAAEQYVLGEMPFPQREEFEEHFFDCALCSEEVRQTAVFADNALAVTNAEQASRAPAKQGSESKTRSWLAALRAPFLLPAAAVCGILLVVSATAFYQLG